MTLTEIHAQAGTRIELPADKPILVMQLLVGGLQAFSVAEYLDGHDEEHRNATFWELRAIVGVDGGFKVPDGPYTLSRSQEAILISDETTVYAQLDAYQAENSDLIID